MTVRAWTSCWRCSPGTSGSCAERGFGQPGTYAEVFAILGREGVLEPGFATELQPMARMRDRLVHHYADIAPARVHEILGSRLDDFDRFAQQVVRHVDGLTPPPG